MLSASNRASDVYCLQSSVNLGMFLVFKPFDGLGFGSWKRFIEIALTVRSKLGFINGTYKKPDLDSDEYQDWEKCNSMVKSWILSSLTKEIFDSIIYMKEASEIWEELEERFGQSNGRQLFQIQQELNQVIQRTSSVNSYFTKIRKLWDEFQDLSDIPHCLCEARHDWQKVQEKHKLMQFLMGLNNSYTNFRGNLLLMKPLPSVRQAYSLLI